MANLLDDNLETANFDGQQWSNPKQGGCSHGHFIKWQTIENQEISILQDVRCIREHPLVAPHIPVYGYLYDVKTGRLLEIEKATEAGRPWQVRQFSGKVLDFG